MVALCFQDGKQGLFSSVGSSEWQEAVDKCTTYPVEYARQSMYGPASPPADMNDGQYSSKSFSQSSLFMAGCFIGSYIVTM